MDDVCKLTTTQPHVDGLTIYYKYLFTHISSVSDISIILYGLIS